jgi:N-acetylneuraminate lyase
MNFDDFRFIAAPHAPLSSDGALDLTIVERQAAYFCDHGVQGAFVAGTTGECASMSDSERRQLAERWVEVAASTDLEVLIQVGQNCQAVAMELAAHAQRIGADAIACLAPSYYKPATVTDLIDYVAPVAATAGDLPFYLYDIPAFTNIHLSMVEFLLQGQERIPNLVGLKYTNPDLLQLQEVIHLEGGRFQVLYGCDEALLAGAAFGADGAVGSTYNFAAPLYRSVVDALAAGDWMAARQRQAKAVKLIRLLQRRGFLASSKSAMAFVGVDCGPTRSPLRALTTKECAELHAELAELDLFAPATVMAK